MRTTVSVPCAPVVATATPGASRTRSVANGRPSASTSASSNTVTEAAHVRRRDRRQGGGDDDVAPRPAARPRGDLERGENRMGLIILILLQRHHDVVSEEPRRPRARSGATHRRLVPAGRGRRRRQVSWLAGRCLVPSSGEGLSAYSCGHSAGFSPASLFTAVRRAAPSAGSGLVRARHGLSIAAPAARARLRFSPRLVGTSQNHGRSKT